jgi:menaquinol-cytochrome c reductase iron-sulfur subunit
MSHAPGPARSPADALRGRRSFLRWLTYGIGALAAAVVTVPFVGYLFGAFRKPKVQWVPLGMPDTFPINETRLAVFDSDLGQPWDGMSARMGVYVRNLGKDEKQQHRFLIFANNCAHLGCPVTWFPQSGLFMCPCHGGVYYENGERASGPPPRGLFQCVWQISDQDGQLEVQAPHLPTLQNALIKPAKG